MKVPVPPLAAMLPVSKRWVFLPVNVCAAESWFVTVTFWPGLTVSVPENAKPLMTIPLDALAAVVAAAGEAVPAGVDDELQAASRMDTAAPAASAYGFIPVTTNAAPAWFSVI